MDSRRPSGVLTSLVLLPILGCGESGPTNSAGASGEIVPAEIAPVRGIPTEIQKKACDSSLGYAETDASACSVVKGVGGEWSPLPGSNQFAASGKVRQCEFTWSSNEGAAPDLASLDRAPSLSHVVDGCEDAITIDLELTETLPDLGGIDGTLGCDVCGIQRERRVQFVLPPDQAVKRIDIPIIAEGPDKKWVSFEIKNTLAPGSYRVKLPAPPKEIEYSPGYVRLRANVQTP